MTVKIRVLVDNNASFSYRSEHGFSAHLEIHTEKILFDMGSGEAIFQNSKKMGISLENLDKIVISHGHYDHTGSLDRILQMNPQAILVAHPEIVTTHISFKDPENPRYIGIDEKSIQRIKSLQENRKCWLERPLLATHYGFTGAIPRLVPFEDTGGSFYRDFQKKEVDLIPDESAMWINTDDGLVVLTGCCHSGFINTCEYVKTLNPKKKIVAVVGGLHLINASKERLEQTVDYIRKEGILKVAACHCSGEDSVKLMRKKLPGIITTCAVGRCYRF